MNLRMVLIVMLGLLVAGSAWAQPRTAPAGDGPKPAMIVGGKALSPAEWAVNLTGDTVTINGISMMYVGQAAKAAGSTVTISNTPEGRILSVRIGIRSLDFLVLPPGEFWRHPWVRHLIAQADIYRLQPLPYFPYVEANIPARRPHHISPRWPYLEWSPDEAWLLLNLEPPPPPAPETIAPRQPEPRATAEDPAAAAAPAPPPPPPGGMGAPPGMGGPPGMDEPPPMDY